MTVLQWVFAWVLYLALSLVLSMASASEFLYGGRIRRTDWPTFWVLFTWWVGVGALVTWIIS